jgi:fused signal recognition particle receptor
MFSKLREKLKGWVKKISEEKSKEEIGNEEKIFNKSKEQEEIERQDNKNQTKDTDAQRQKAWVEKQSKEKPKKIEEHEYIKSEKREFDEKEREISDKIIEDIHKEEKEKKQSIFKRLLFKRKFISEKDFKEYSEELQMILLENNVALEVSDKIIQELEEQIVGKEYHKKEIEAQIKNTLKKIIEDILIEPFDLIPKIRTKEPKPFTILFCGINGTGKTTTIAKIAHLLKKQKITSVIAAADTFRAASIEQIKKHGYKLGIKVISHEYGTDPASVGFDATKYAERTRTDCVLIDSAGRMHTAKNLLREMEKIKRVCKPDLTIFVGESITGNDATEQVKAFNETIGIDAIILSKADIDEKGGAALSVGYTTGKPIIYLGTGQEYDKIEKFNKKNFLKSLDLNQ